MPLFNGGTALYYNTDMLTEAGITAPPTTMDEIIADAKKLANTDASGSLNPLRLSLRLSGQGSGVAEKFWILLLQYGKTLIRETSPGKWQAEYNGPEGVKLFQMYVDFLKANVDSLNIDHDAKAFETKATAMFLREAWVVPRSPRTPRTSSATTRPSPRRSATSSPPSPRSSRRRRRTRRAPGNSSGS